MSVLDVVAQIQQLRTSGEPLSKKKVKQEYPELLQNALYYFPSWDHAIQNADTLE
jgi:hypothetical protein